MKREKKEKKKILVLICLLFIFGLGLGYAVLSEQLTLNSSVNYETMKWSVGFSASSNGSGTVAATTSVSEDKKTLTITCNLGTSTSAETCIAKTTIKNDSTFNVKLIAAPSINYDNTYISSVKAVWTDSSQDIALGDTVNASASKELQITISTKELTKDLLPSTTLKVPVTIALDWQETE